MLVARFLIIAFSSWKRFISASLQLHIICHILLSFSSLSFRTFSTVVLISCRFRISCFQASYSSNLSLAPINKKLRCIITSHFTTILREKILIDSLATCSFNSLPLILAKLGSSPRSCSRDSSSAFSIITCKVAGPGRPPGNVISSSCALKQ